VSADYLLDFRQATTYYLSLTTRDLPLPPGKPVEENTCIPVWYGKRLGRKFVKTAGNPKHPKRTVLRLLSLPMRHFFAFLFANMDKENIFGRTRHLAVTYRFGRNSLKKQLTDSFTFIHLLT
jgi:hypothetical protein